MLINAETRGMTLRTIWCNISKKLEREKLNEKYKNYINMAINFSILGLLIYLTIAIMNINC